MTRAQLEQWAAFNRPLKKSKWQRAWHWLKDLDNQTPGPWATLILAALALAAFALWLWRWLTLPGASFF